MGDPKPIREIRQCLVRSAEGTVLEIGAGSGANFVHYDPARVTKLYALEPNRGMIALADGAEQHWTSNFWTCPESAFLSKTTASIRLSARSR